MDELELLIQDFLNYKLTIQGKSINTVNTYKYDLLLFSTYIRTNNLNIKTISTNDLYNYVLTMKDLSNTTKRKKVACIRSFFKFLTNKEKYLDNNPALELEYAKQIKQLPIYLSLDECKQLLSVITKPRDFCLISIFLHCGLRISELCNLNLNDVKDDYIKVLGKGGKERTIPLDSTMKDILHSYIRNYRNPIKAKDNALFLSRLKHRISVDAVQLILKNYLKLAGLEGRKYSPHKLRHSFSTNLYKAGVNILTLKEILGHSTVTSTQIYTHIENAELQKAINSHPLAHFKKK